MKKLAFVLLLFLPVAVLAQEQLGGIAPTYWRSTTQTLAADGCVESTTSVCALFPAANSTHHKRRAVVLTAGGEGDCCWVGDPAVALTGSNVTSGGSTGTGPGACARFEYDGHEVHGRPSRTVQRTATSPGTVHGLCPTAVGPGAITAGAGDSLYAPCIPGNACAAAYGGGDCVAPGALSSAQIDSAGMFLVCDIGTVVSVRKERLPFDHEQ